MFTTIFKNGFSIKNAAKLFLTLTFLIVSFASFAQPANDDCTGAVVLTPSPNTTCVATVAGTTVAATASTAPNPTCGLAGGANDDVWYSFVATSAAHTITLSNITGASTDLQIATYSGTCGALTEVQCSNPVTTTVSSLTVGNTYYVRVYTNSSSASNTASFDICITTPPPPPANDDCSGAVALTVNSGTTCTATTAGTTVNATASTAPATTCSPTGINDDVWYSFTATSSAHIITLSAITPSANTMAISLYSGSCSGLTYLSCVNGASYTAGGLTVGSTYYVRVYTQSATAGTNASFNICVATPPPPPANDECAGAISVPVNPTLTCTATVDGATVSATQSSSVPNPSCLTTVGWNDDVWFKFVATGPVHVVTLTPTTGSGTTDLAMAVYSGACGSLTEVGCSDPNSLQVSGLTAGQTYYIRVWTWTATVTTTATFTVCVGTPPPPPANDDCAAAVTVPVNPTLTCTNTVAGTTVSATATTGVPSPTCVTAAGTNDDVWFKFVATNPLHQISLLNVTGVTTDMAMTVYSGTCASLTQIACSDPNTMVVTGLTVGQTYYIRVWTWTSTSTSSASFDICVGTPPPPPANDECSGAISITPTTATTCTTQTAGETSWATLSSQPAPSCGTTTAMNDDVWYSFVASSPYHTVTTSAGTNALNFAVYSGSCGTFTELLCSTIASNTVTGLTVGQTYYIRVWTSSTTAGTFATFNICVSTPPPPPANDNPCTAALLVASENGDCNYQTFTNVSATSSQGVPAPGCANYQGGDVWFKVVVPCTGKISIDTKNMDITDGGMALYKGSCNNLTLISCDDDSSPNGLMPALTGSNLIPGDTVYIRFWEYGNNVFGNFGICVGTISNASTTPSGSCATALSFCVQNQSQTISVTAQPSVGPMGCLSTTPNPQYFYLNITSNGGLHFTISQVSTNGTPIDVDYALFGPFTTLTQACAGLNPANIISCNYSGQATEYINVDPVTIGQIYVLMVTNYNGGAGTTTFTPGTTSGGNPGGTIGTPGPNTTTTNCCTIDATNSGPKVCPGSTFNLFSSAVANATYSWTGPNCFTSTQQNPTGVTAPNTPGVYVYYVSATSPNGAVCSDTTRITVMPRPNFGADTSVKVCAGSTVNLNALYTLTGLTSAWTLNGTTVSNPGAVSVSGIYMLVGVNTTGCKDTAYANVKIDTVQAVATTTNLTCTTKGSATVTPIKGIAPYQYAISTAPTVFQTANVFNNLPVGNYVITTKDSLGCTTTNNVRIDSVNTLTLNVRSDTLLCNGDGTTLTTVSNATSFNWTPSTGLSSATVKSPFAKPLATTTYTVTAVLGVCTKQASVKLTVDAGISVSAGPDITIMSGDQATFQGSASSTPSSIAWTPVTDLIDVNTLFPTVKPAFTSGTRTYTVTVTNAMGCVSKDSAIVTVIPYCVKAKNAFSPNGDGINDKWEVYESYDCLKNVTVNVYNRYGSKVFENKNYSNNWDGRYNGKPVPDGTYYAVINYTLITGRILTIKTDVNIIR